ncbi:recombination protein F [Achromobacter denitrificans]|nr:recombination protein F [Achromobacter denitrificans]
MEKNPLRALHLHTIDSLCADLISVRPVGVGKDDTPFQLASDAARSVLNWYYSHKNKWAGNVQSTDVEAIVDCTAKPPDSIPEAIRPPPQEKKSYTLVSICAHQFGGLHRGGSSKGKPEDFTFSFGPGVTMFEGFNGCGKTSLLNAIIWTLTGEVLRPQRAPEPANKEFTCEIDGASEHTLSPVMPLPDPSVEKPASAAIPVDTWVELVFEDESKTRYSVRRSQKRTARGKLQEEESGLATLGLDPVGARIGTVMPGLLPFIQVGSDSKLGRAVAELTGMAPLVDLASHAERVKKKIDGDFKKDREKEIQSFDEAFNRSRADLLDIFAKNPAITFGKAIPEPSADGSVETLLTEALEHLEGVKAKGLADAKTVLGESFDPDEARQRSDLEDNIQPALSQVSKGISSLPSATRLSALAKLTAEEIEVAKNMVASLKEESEELAKLAADPDKAGRLRLYSRIAAWQKEHVHLAGDENSCIVCGNDLKEAVDPVTGAPVKDHLRAAAASDSDFLGKTFSAWAKHELGQLSHNLPEVLGQEIRSDLPEHPGSLIRKALVEELFNTEPFKSSLGLLKPGFENACDKAISAFPAMEISALPELGNGHKDLAPLNAALTRLNKAIAFAEWRNAHKTKIAAFMQSIVGQAPASDKPTAPKSLLTQLHGLKAMVDGIEPVSQAITLIKRMGDDIKTRREKEKRLAAYVVTSEALAECMNVGELAEHQVGELQNRLHKKAVDWRSRIYTGAFPSTNLDLVATKMNGDGELQLMVGAAGLAAPAQHVSNASALRASLVGFFLAYWEYMLEKHGGLKLLLLDDPQELLDVDNREKLADSIKSLRTANAQLILTTHDGKFAASIARRAHGTNVELNHQYVHPATAKTDGRIRLTPSVTQVQLAHDAYVDNYDDAANAQHYVSECRVFIEGRMGDIFDDGAFPTASTHTFAPTFADHLNRLRGLMKSGSNELFKSSAFSAFCNDPALKDKAPALVLLNKAHHSSKLTIRPAEVKPVVTDLERVRRLIESLHQEFRLFCRREPLSPPLAKPAAIQPVAVPNFKVLIRSSLAAFVRGANVGDSQETDFEELSSSWFDGKAFFLLRSSNLGFAGPATSVAIVEAELSRVEDRRLVIVRHGKETYARRALCPVDTPMLALAAETPDPRKSPPTLLLREDEVALHRIVGMLLNPNVTSPASKSEAVQVDGSGCLANVKSAYKIKEDSAIPLALPGQIALGGEQIKLHELDKHFDAYVALHLDDGSSIFKRVGEKLPAPLSHLRRFETIGGLGVADILSVGQPHQGFRAIEKAVLVLGILYHL